MPCNTVIRIPLKLKDINREWMRDALTEMGYTVDMSRRGMLYFRKGVYGNTGSINEVTGELAISRSEANAAEKIADAYGEIVLVKTAEEYGWIEVDEDSEVILCQ